MACTAASATSAGNGAMPLPGWRWSIRRGIEIERCSRLAFGISTPNAKRKQMDLQGPALAILAADEALGGIGGGAELGGVPGNALAGADGDVAKQGHFRERAGIIEVAPGSRATLARADPVGVMVLRFHARPSLGRRTVVAEVVHRQQPIFAAVIRRGIERALAADEHAAAVRRPLALEEGHGRPPALVPQPPGSRQ